MTDKNDSFAREMAKIGKQAEAEQLAELQAERRHAQWAKARKVMLVLALVGLGSAAYCQRDQISDGVSRLAAKTGLTGGSGKSLTGYSEANEKLQGSVQGLQATAAKRNQLVDEITAGAAAKAPTAKTTAATTK